jgi:hypothetical protein
MLVVAAQLANSQAVNKPVEMWWASLYKLLTKNKEAGISRLRVCKSKTQST